MPANINDNSAILVKFGARLREVRTEKHISQETLAFDSGYDRTYISLLERGKRNPSLATIHRLATVLEVDVADFFPRTER